jgi:hypothetical protein
VIDACGRRKLETRRHAVDARVGPRHIDGKSIDVGADHRSGGKSLCCGDREHT